MPGHSSGTSFRLGHLCPLGHELRITQRCLEEDLEEDPDNSQFSELCGKHPIVGAFLDRRLRATAGADTVGPEAGDKTLTVLRHTNDLRGATWHDGENEAVWLCAVGFHRSGASYDAFRHFKALLKSGEMYPEADDLVRLESDRGAQFRIRARDGVPGLLAEAQAAEGEEKQRIFGRDPVSCVVHVVQTAEERFFAMSARNYADVMLVAELLVPGKNLSEWETRPRLPTRDLSHERQEMCWATVV